MDIHTFLVSPADIARRKGPHDRIVMSSRVRLARNIRDAAFPGWAKKPERVRVLDLIRPAIEGLPDMKDSFSDAMDSLSTLDKQILVERHLISREHAAKSAGSGLVFVNYYGAGVSDAYRGAIISAENYLQSQFTNPVTVGVSFDLQSLGQTFSAQNTFSTVSVSFATLTAALRAHATQVDPDGFWFRAPLAIQQKAWSTEEYELVRSLVDSELPEDDLFAGVRESVRT